MRRALPVAAAILLVGSSSAGCDTSAGAPVERVAVAAEAQAAGPGAGDARDSEAAPTKSVTTEDHVAASGAEGARTERASASPTGAGAVAAVGDAPGIAGSLPEIDRRRVGSRRDATAAQLLQEASKLASSGDHEQAKEKLRELVELDNGHTEARYELGRVLANSGEHDGALAVLEQLRDAGCPDCLYRVLASRDDRRWGALRKDERYKSLVKDVQARVPSYEQATAVIRSWALSPDSVDPPVILDPRADVEVSVVCSGCDKRKPEVKTLRGARAVARWYKKLHGPTVTFGHVIAGDTIKCNKKGCCEYKRADKTQERGHLYLDKVCFKTVAEGPLWVTALAVTEGG